MTYPISFRRHVLAAKERDGLTFAQASARFSIGIASLVRWSAKLEPKAYRREPGSGLTLRNWHRTCASTPTPTSTSVPPGSV